jgi:hypothetical protein
MNLTMATILIVAKIGVRNTNVYLPTSSFPNGNHLHAEILAV